MSLITCNALLNYANNAGIDPAIPLGLLGKLWGWYAFEDSVDDAWGAWPLAQANVAASYGDASSYGSGVSGRVLTAGNLFSRPVLPNWGTSTSFFQFAMRSTPSFINDQHTTFIGKSGFNEAVALTESATGFRSRGVNGATAYSADTTDSTGVWTLTVVQHDAAGTVRNHKNATMNAATNSGSATLNPTHYVGIGSANGANSTGANIAFMGFGLGDMTADELSYLYAGGAGRDIADIIVDAAYVTDTVRMELWSGTLGANAAVSFSGKRFSRHASGTGNAYVRCNTEKTTGLLWCAFKAIEIGSSNVLAWISDSTTAERCGRFLNANANNLNGTLFTAATACNLTYATSDIVMIAVNFTAGKVWFGKNGTWAGDPAAGTGHAFTFSTGSTPSLKPVFAIDTYASFEAYLKTAEMPYSNPTGFTPWGD